MPHDTNLVRTMCSSTNRIGMGASYCFNGVQSAVPDFGPIEVEHS